MALCINNAQCDSLLGSVPLSAFITSFNLCLNLGDAGAAGGGGDRGGEADGRSADVSVIVGGE